MKKELCCFLATVMCLSSVGSIASAAEAVGEKENVTPIQNSPLLNQEMQSIERQPWDELVEIGYHYGQYEIKNGSIKDATPQRFMKSFNFFDHHLRVENISHDDYQPKYIDVDTFSNETDVEQIYMSIAHSETFEETETATITQHYALGVESRLSFELIVKASGAIKFQVDFSKADTTKRSHSETLTLNSQPVKVPPHKKYKLKLVMAKTATTADIKLTSKVNADVYKAFGTDGKTFYSEKVNPLLNHYRQAQEKDSSLPNLLKNWEVQSDASNEDAPVLYNGGQGHVKAEYGSDFRAQVVDITNGEDKAVVVSEKAIQLVRQ
ncbi:hypothetical protein UAW_00586 [Enterococcus haemoperoxidus ATCC BAA-382]|uniref:MucBP domain-containing protein n=1 Tax=Enterococcus haemoperoxidus ATCC BAA-382 TaxID=1158608 RepID=R2TH02_9ENTE|nr:ETX/MTX2 family pore-forming toxin [Enterococcus haemoperoxidus]EOH99434.1 hypothetical protein UAW_00586 [Enterococcus haemoperoxidus ATCC BAA-382]EOT62825.1 hypothetical protein I583_01826 [Enterococcus haemoperoxidus ATCC BAA-382]OJG52258.1 hypothetical protein RV06_GL001071 [Enterococcus haemoperoxidus]